MKKRLLRALARLASIRYQEEYVIGGTSDEYAVPEDIIEEVASLCKMATRDQHRSTFSSAELARLDDLGKAIVENGKTIFSPHSNLDANSLIYHCQEWAELRRGAANCLTEFGINVDILLPKQIDEDDGISWLGAKVARLNSERQ